MVFKQCCQTGSLEGDPKMREFWKCCFRKNVMLHAPQKANMCKGKYLLIWELVLLKHAFCGQAREARSADLAANRMPQAGVLCSIGMDFAPWHGSNSSPADRNGGFWFSLKQILPAYRVFRLKTQLPNDSWNFCKVWLRKRTCVVSSPFLVSAAQKFGELIRLIWFWKLWIKC